MLLDKLAFTENKYDELSVKISDPSIMANQTEWRKLCKEHAELEVIVNAYKEYKKVVDDLQADKEMLVEENAREESFRYLRKLPRAYLLSGYANFKFFE